MQQDLKSMSRTWKRSLSHTGVYIAARTLLLLPEQPSGWHIGRTHTGRPTIGLRRSTPALTSWRGYSIPDSRFRGKDFQPACACGLKIKFLIWRSLREVFFYSPAMVIDSISIDPVRMLPRRSTSLPTAAMPASMFFILPAIVISSTGYWISPFSTQKPPAPRE
jgi:hypothetical protein